MEYRSQQREAVGAASHEREMLTDLDPRHVGANRPEGPADGVRGFGLEVPGVKLAGAADKQQLDARPFGGPISRTQPLEMGQLG
jgi:hypothetical protein